jgi:hypothetical protein
MIPISACGKIPPVALKRTLHYSFPESKDMLLYLAGINGHAVFAHGWKQAMERSTFSEDNSAPFRITEFASQQLNVAIRAVKAYAAGRNGINSCWPTNPQLSVRPLDSFDEGLCGNF